MARLALLGGRPLRNSPFPGWPVFDEGEERSLASVLTTGKWWQQSFGEATEGQGDSKVGIFQEQFAKAHDARFGIACSTGTAALEIVLKALGITNGDEVIVPPYTFIATATAALLIGAVPVFCDIDPETYNLNPQRLEEAITPRTKAIVAVHFAGLAADMDAILAVANRHGLPVVEDAAHAHGGSWKGHGLGSIGTAGTFSFQASKNMTAGEGGLITTNDGHLAEVCESLVWVGRKVGRPWYEHHRLGWNYRLTEFQAAILIEQLKRLETQSTTRLRNGIYLSKLLARIPGIQPLAVPPYATKHAFHIYLFRFREREFGLTRDEFLAALTAENIPCTAGYAFPLYRNPLFKDPAMHVDPDHYAATCPEAEKACHQAVWLEHRLLLGNARDMEDIAGAVEKIHRNRSEFSSAVRDTVLASV